jgi:hypothetical protein
VEHDGAEVFGTTELDAMEMKQVSDNCFAVLNQKNRVCDANSRPAVHPLVIAQVCKQLNLAKPVDNA